MNVSRGRATDVPDVSRRIWPRCTWGRGRARFRSGVGAPTVSGPPTPA